MMITRVQPTGGVSPDAEEPEQQLASSPEQALRIAILMLATREGLHAGDTLTCRRGDDDRAPDLREVSRSSHYS
jgi:hypothetical protein